MVNDDPTVCEVVTRYLARDGNLVMDRDNGTDGLPAAMTMHPNLVVIGLGVLVVPGSSTPNASTLPTESNGYLPGHTSCGWKLVRRSSPRLASGALFLPSKWSKPLAMLHLRLTRPAELGSRSANNASQVRARAAAAATAMAP